ncbi:MAG: hypothetical protein FJ295_03780 [Planctomycetes bacterium]|nr:hypothetical protein [Planctomycetota bacterium]
MNHDAHLLNAISALRRGAMFAALLLAIGVLSSDRWSAARLRANEQADGPSPGAAGKIPPSLARRTIVFRDPTGGDRYRLKAKGDDAAKLFDARENEVGKLTLYADRIKAKSADDKPLFELKRKDDKLMLKDAADKELYKWKLKGDRLSLYRGDKSLCQIRIQAGETQLIDPQGKVRAQAALKKSVAELTDSSGKLLLASQELTDASGLIFFEIRELTPLQQAACLLFFLRN